MQTHMQGLHTQIMHIRKKTQGCKAMIIYCSSQYCKSAIWSMFIFSQPVRQVLETTCSRVTSTCTSFWSKCFPFVA